MSAPPSPPWLLHADDGVLVVDKPAGLLAVPGRGEGKSDCMSARVQAQFADAQIVHRLDMATSGLMLFARGVHAQRTLSAAFMRRAVHKRYTAVVAGRMAAAHGEIDLPLKADWPNRPRQMVAPTDGKPSLTRWAVLAHDGEQRTRLALEPVTGRSHQLRVHLMAIGHAILGDEFYAGPAERAAAPRLLLHASEIGFDHPLSGAPLSFSSAVPF